MFLSDLSIKQPVLATMLSVSLVVLGVFSYNRLSIDLYPDVEIPVLTVQTQYPGASPETVEREVSKRIEEVVNTVSGVKHISSITTEGFSSIVIEFTLGTRLANAQQDSQAKINAIRAEFPREMKEPVIQRFDIGSLPIVSIAVESATADIKALSSLAEKTIKKRIETVPGVGQVNLVGLARREIQIFADRDKLKAYGVTYAELSGALARENMDMPAGKLEQGKLEPLVRVAGKYKNVDDFRNLIVAHRSGRPIYLPQVARIVDGIEDRRSASLIDNQPGLALEIVRQSGANSVAVADGVIKAMEDLNRQLPPQIRLRKVVDNSVYIRESVEDVQTTILLGGALTVLIVFLFLNSWRSTVITGLALPVSVISTFTVMYALNFTLNVLTLMGLSLAIGLLIDDAIVVRENIVRHLHHGQDHFTAAREATAEIGLAVMATTFTIIAVFVPVAFMGGIMGRFFYQFGITVGVAVLLSLYVSFTLDPMLSSRWYDPAADPNVPRSWFGRKLEWLNEQLDRLQKVLGTTLGWSLRHRWVVVVGATAAIFVSFALFGKLGSAFMPEADEGQYMVRYKADPSISLERSVDIARELVAEIRKDPSTAYTYTSIGANGTQPVNEGNIFVKLAPREGRRHVNLVRVDMRERMARFRAIKVSIGRADEMSADTKPIQMSFRGPELSRMAPISQKLMKLVAEVPGAKDIDTSLEEPRPEVRINVDRRSAGDLGLDLGTVASTMSGLVAGNVVSQFEDPDGDSYDVRLRIDPVQRVQGSDILGLDLPGRGGTVMVPLNQVARLEDGVAPSKIRRRDLMREIRVSANTEGRSLGEVIGDIKARVAAMNLPAGYHVTFTGESEDMAESFGYVWQSLVLAVVLIYAILASQFRSFVQPFAIMLSLPLSLVGVAGMLFLAKDTLNIMSLIGLILLMGLVTKNAILLIDFTNVQRRDGVPRFEAILGAAHVRLRPILMTTLAMIFGMLPLAFEIGSGAEARAPMARAVIGGLITSTILTLVVVPVVYTYFDDLSEWFGRLWHRGTPRHAREVMEEVR
jgi:hydrophobic/amphiphilic exporter-1 (mainly G- bacteria), HAE1 family